MSQKWGQVQIVTRETIGESWVANVSHTQPEAIQGLDKLLSSREIGNIGISTTYMNPALGDEVPAFRRLERATSSRHLCESSQRL